MQAWGTGSGPLESPAISDLQYSQSSNQTKSESSFVTQGAGSLALRSHRQPLTYSIIKAAIRQNQSPLLLHKVPDLWTDAKELSYPLSARVYTYSLSTLQRHQ